MRFCLAHKLLSITLPVKILKRGGGRVVIHTQTHTYRLYTGTNKHTPDKVMVVIYV